ncbi:hypothetical protein AB6A40_003172 [Gnathostoma spinigerum]|uniref:CRAL-TRIO domain-containing protein n=1 Tax=Gnathostoma spinigerum TaxID=75299 RepID=A0ABD6E8R2_9BILA
MSAEEDQSVSLLRSLLGDTLRQYPMYDTRFSLERWSAFDSDLDVVARSMKKALNTLSKVGALDLNNMSIECLSEKFISVAPSAKYFPGGIVGPDNEGNIICIQPLGRVRPRKLICTGRVSDLYRAVIIECEACLALVRKEEEKRGRKLGVVIIFDVAGFSPTVFYLPAIKVYLNLLSLVQNLFPDSLTKVYVINASWTINGLFRMIKGVLPQVTVEKIEFLGTDWRSVLCSKLGERNIPEFWGGIMKSVSPTGYIRMGGDIPDKLSSSITKLQVPDCDLMKITIKARSEAKIPVEVAQIGAVLSWYFTCSCGDIDFSVTHDGVEVWPMFRISTEFFPEYGEVICSKTGLYEVVFSNKHGKVWNKVISYSLHVKPLDVTTEGLV